LREYQAGENDPQKEEVEHFFEEPDEQSRYLSMLLSGLVAKDIDQRRMDLSLRMVEKSFFGDFVPFLLS
jgi:hypothetical protein